MPRHRFATSWEVRNASVWHVFVHQSPAHTVSGIQANKHTAASVDLLSPVVSIDRSYSSIADFVTLDYIFFILFTSYILISDYRI